MISANHRAGRLEARLRSLASHERPNSFSILMPTHRTHPQTDQDPIRLKNAIDLVADALEGGGLASRVVDGMLAPLRRHFDDRSFWQHRDLGFAVYGAPDTEPVEIDVPVSLKPRVHVGGRFKIAPLVAALDELAIPTLVLSRGGVSLYELDGEGAWRVDCDLPHSMTDVNWFVDRESHLQQRPQPPGGDGGGFHGHDPEQDEDEDLRRYLDAIVSELTPALAERKVPLVVAAPGDLAANLSAMLDHQVVPHPAVEPEGDEHRVARAVQDTRHELLARRRGEIRAELSDRIGRGEVIDEFTAALQGAATGRVARLAVLPDAAPIWGTFDENSLDVALHEARRPDDDDLVDRLVGLTMDRGGDIEPIDEPIDGRWFVAVARYDDPQNEEAT